MTVPGPFAKALASVPVSEAPAWVQDYQKSGRDWLAANQLPNLKVEEWKYTSLRPLSDLSFVQPEHAGEVNEALLSSKLMDGAVPIVLVDGFLCPSYSRLGDLPAGVKVQPLREAWQSKREQIDQLTVEDHPFSKLNQALLGAGLIVEVDAGTVVEKPIQILHWQSAANGSVHLSCPRVLVSAGKGCQMSLLETYGGESGANLTAVSAGYWVEDNADLRVYRAQIEHEDALHFSTVKAFLGRDARCELFSFSRGARLARQDIYVYIEGEGAELCLDGVYLARGNQHTDLHSSVHHRVPHAQSSQLYKGILDDSARSVFNGKVFVHKDAQQTNAFQLNKNLMLSEDAEIDTKPELQIDADDVKCSHGATVGQINEDELFYLRSRAIPEPQAKVMLCRAYVGDVLVKVKDAKVGQWLKAQLSSYFGGTARV